jgi:uncharacterized protein (TIGR02001 family)
MSGGAASQHAKRRRRHFGGVGVALALISGARFAGEAAAAEYELTGALGLDSKGSFRGVKSQDLNPAVYGYVELVRGKMLAGVFSNPVKIQGEITPLVLTYAAWKPSVGRFDFEAGARYYTFPGSSDFTYDFNRDGIVDHAGHKGLFEAQAGVRRKFKGGRVHLRGFVTPDNFAETGPAWYFNGEARANIAHGFEARGGIGYSGFENTLYNDNYVDYDVGIYKSALGFDMYVRYSDTAGLAGSDNSIVVFGIERSFTLAASSGADRRRFDKIRNDWLVDKSRLGLVH